MKDAFENDPLLARWMEREIEKQNIFCVLETGTETGATAAWFGKRVPLVLTCDVDNLIDRDLGENVHFYRTASTEMLKEALPNIGRKSLLFWLDAHFCPHTCALLDELDVLSSYPDLSYRWIIAVHDFEVPYHPLLGFDVYGNLGALMYPLIESRLRKIYPQGFTMSFNTSAEGAKRGVGLFSSISKN